MTTLKVDQDKIRDIIGKVVRRFARSRKNPAPRWTSMTTAP
ncbi:MAG: hypothetical protein CM15mP74_23730 [Halieaceae bacterium]|nr:MAG: hypothetical protein CM15mP74_23730 [Halieaceae bacterium]